MKNHQLTIPNPFCLPFCSYECCNSYCQDCAPADTTRCQYCNEMYCNDNRINQCVNCMFICEGEGCSRANCNGNQRLAETKNCGTENENRQDCVREYEDEEGVHTFCGDCWEKNRKEIEERDNRDGLY